MNFAQAQMLPLEKKTRMCVALAKEAACHRHERTPVDEALGQPCQDAVLDVVNSFHKTPVFAVAPAPATDPQPDDEFGDAEDADVEMSPAKGQTATPADAGAPASVGQPGANLPGS